MALSAVSRVRRGSVSHWALGPAGGALTVFIQVRGLQLEATGLVQSPGCCTDCSGCGSECDHSVVFALRASLEGEGTEVSEAIQPGMVHGTYKGYSWSPSRPTA